MIVVCLLGTVFAIILSACISHVYKIRFVSILSVLVSIVYEIIGLITDLQIFTFAPDPETYLWARQLKRQGA